MFNTSLKVQGISSVHHCTTGIVDLESDSNIHLNYIVCINQSRSAKQMKVLHINSFIQAHKTKKLKETSGDPDDLKADWNSYNNIKHF